MGEPGKGEGREGGLPSAHLPAWSSQPHTHLLPRNFGVSSPVHCCAVPGIKLLGLWGRFLCLLSYLADPWEALDLSASFIALWASCRTLCSVEYVSSFLAYFPEVVVVSDGLLVLVFTHQEELGQGPTHS